MWEVQVQYFTSIESINKWLSENTSWQPMSVHEKEYHVGVDRKASSYSVWFKKLKCSIK